MTRGRAGLAGATAFCAEVLDVFTLLSFQRPLPVQAGRKKASESLSEAIGRSSVLRRIRVRPKALLSVVGDVLTSACRGGSRIVAAARGVSRRRDEPQELPLTRLNKPIFDLHAG